MGDTVVLRSRHLGCVVVHERSNVTAYALMDGFGLRRKIFPLRSWFEQLPPCLGKRVINDHTFTFVGCRASAIQGDEELEFLCSATSRHVGVQQPDESWMVGAVG